MKYFILEVTLIAINSYYSWNQVKLLPVKGVVGLLLRDEIMIEYISLAESLSNVRILACFMRWWFRTRRILSFFDKFCLILSFHISGIACINWTHWKYMWLSRWYSSFNGSANLIFFLWKFSKVNNTVIYNYMLVKQQILWKNAWDGFRICW